MKEGSKEASDSFGCLETGCNNVECEHLTWGPPHCMLLAEGPGEAGDRASKTATTEYKLPAR
jgi:hypothetical protein